MKLSVFLEDELSITKGSIKLNIKSQLEKYREKYEALIAKKKLVVDYYRIMPSKTAIIWVKVPSQSLDKFYYDVLIQLTPVDGATKFEDCEVKFFSNSPSFVYGGYAYIFYHMDSDPNAPDGKGMMIDQFRTKVPRDNLLVPRSAKELGKEAVTEEPIVRNRLGIPIPDFSIYCAIFHIIDNMRFRTVMNSRNYRTILEMLSYVRSFDELMHARRLEANKEQRTKERKKQLEKAEAEKQLKSVTRKAGSMKTASGSTVRHMTKPKSTATRRPATNRGKKGGVNRIG